ncbi:hypothetical protein GOM49_14670 [Clostridium bovifaecis]|uniref:ABC3 transporter permease C-terminal domain-containing protein n=1 Tax=Clostridium bovifaecis TaxID=2184719 RepID=A0A6I6F4Q8_9CLOT|nr:hypothetical protein GOM49_14670 [Clostridium bovifaecis]
MTKGSLRKDILRDIKKSLGRFISILAIVALGVAFFSGVKIAPQDMKNTADKYYDDYNLMDIRIVSTLGLTEGDLDEIRKIEGIEDTFGTYTLDALAEYNEKEVVLRVHGLPQSKNINNVNLLEGRLPERSGECVIEKGKNNSITVSLGSNIKLHSGKDEPLSDSLKSTEYKVVGMVQTPYYLSFEKGSSDIGNGQVRNFIMIPQEDFKMGIFTDIFATVKGARKLNSYRDEYFDAVHKVTDRVKNLAKEREILRYDDILKESREKLEKGKKEYLEKKHYAEGKLEKALKEIEDGKSKVENGEKKLIEEERNFNIFIKSGKEQIVKAEMELAKEQEKYENGVKIYNERKALANKGFKSAEEQIKKGEERIATLENKIAEIKAALENPLLPEEEIKRLSVSLQTTIRTLNEIKEKVENVKKELEEKKSELAKGEKELNKSKAILALSREKLEKEKVKLQESERRGLEEFKEGREKIQKSKADLAKGEAEYKDSKKKAYRELSNAWKKIEDGEKDLKKIEKGKWYVLDRKSHYSYVDYGGAADRIDALSKVFPVFFALVAALVCLTTMTRMVDEQRGNIGTLKALGYGSGAI